MGVRYGEREWKETVEKLIADNRAAITQILREYNVPLIDERGDLVRKINALLPCASLRYSRRPRWSDPCP
jgi:hypothetical protein